MSLAAGDPLGPYQVIAPLGAGGMGEIPYSESVTVQPLTVLTNIHSRLHGSN